MGVPDVTLMDAEAPDWRERLLDKVREREASASKVAAEGRRRSQVQVNFDVEFSIMLKAACEQRGISIGAYTRRALAKQIAADLGIDWTIPLSYCARATGYGSKQPGAVGKWGVERSFDDGTGYGDWT